MNWNILQWPSLKTRVTLTMLAIFVTGIWSLAFYASRMLRDDMERMLADQQSSTVSYVAAELNDALQERLVALEDYEWGLSGTTGIAVEVLGSDRELRLPPEMEIALYRIAQEVLTNCAKHAKATTVTIALDGDAEKLVFVIDDDGIGFDPMRLSEGENRPGLGLLSMRERAEAIGATLSVESAPGSGTRIAVRT